MVNLSWGTWGEYLIRWHAGFVRSISGEICKVAVVQLNRKPSSPKIIHSIKISRIGLDR